MSSSDHDELNLDLFTEGEEGQAMDIELLGSSEHEGDGELDPQQVDEASHKEGTPNVTDWGGYLPITENSIKRMFFLLKPSLS